MKKSLSVIALLCALLNVATANPCQDVPSGNFVSNPISCQHWFQCHNNNIINEGVCPGSLYFCPVTQMCRYPIYVECSVEVEVECPADASGKLIFLPHPTNCQFYIICINGIAHHLSCADGLHWGVAAEECDIPEIAQCQISDGPNNLCTAGTEVEFVPSPISCSRYYICINGVPNGRYCADGLHFDPSIGTCNLKELVNCQIENPEDPGNTDYECDPNILFYVTYYRPDCSKYIQCVNGVGELRSCAENLLFDPDALRCDFPQNVNCRI